MCICVYHTRVFLICHSASLRHNPFISANALHVSVSLYVCANMSALCVPPEPAASSHARTSAGTRPRPVCMCMYVCMYACMHACMYACMHACMYVCMFVCMYVRTYVASIYLCIYSYTCRACACVCISVNMRTYIRQTYIYVWLWSCSQYTSSFHTCGVYVMIAGHGEMIA